jgi:hypothetical protein
MCFSKLLTVFFLVGCSNPVKIFSLGEKIYLCPSVEIQDCELELTEAIWGTEEGCGEGSVSVGVKELSGLGNANLTRGEIWIDPSAQPEAMRYDGALVLAHEVGHFYGLKHSSGKCDLMASVSMYSCEGFQVLGSWYEYKQNSACF